MAVLTPTADVGARSRSTGATSVDPARHMTEEERERFLADTDLNGPFVADLLSNMLTHERCGTHLYRSVASRSQNPVLKKRYEEFGKETLHHVKLLEDLITALGGDPLYVSPIARATEKADSSLVESTYMLGGSVDVMDQEMVMLDAVLVAEAKDTSNWLALASLIDSFPEGQTRNLVQAAVDDASGQEAEHLNWAREMRTKMVGLQASSSAMTAAGAKAEEMLATVKSWFD